MAISISGFVKIDGRAFLSKAPDAAVYEFGSSNVNALAPYSMTSVPELPMFFNTTATVDAPYGFNSTP
jgi:hypothetical protein